MKISWILLIIGIWLIRFVSEEFLLNLLPKEYWFWIGTIIIIYASHRLGKKGFNIKRWFK